jgi:hypothetical protein
MAPLAELDAQFSRDGAASAIGGIAGDADLHRKSKVRCPKSDVCETTTDDRCPMTVMIWSAVIGRRSTVITST